MRGTKLVSPSQRSIIFRRPSSKGSRSSISSSSFPSASRTLTSRPGCDHGNARRSRTSTASSFPGRRRTSRPCSSTISSKGSFTRHHLDRIAGLYFTLDDHLRHPATPPDDELRQIAVPLAELTAGHAHVGDLNDAIGTHPKPIPFRQLEQVEPARREILPDVTLVDVYALLAEPGVQLFAVDAHGAIGPPMVLAVLLPVARDAVAGHPRARDRDLGHPT